MFRRELIVACGFAPALLLGACASQPRVNTAESANPASVPHFIEDSRVTRDPRLGRDVALVGIIEGDTPAGLKIVEAELYNASNRRQGIRYRFEWFGAGGLSVGSATSVWRDRALIAGERTRISAVAPNPTAVDFQLEIIRAD